MTVSLHLGDCVTWARGYSGDPFHALFCDAPYEMQFMGKGWDASGVAFDPETWKALARPLYDGAFLFVFAGTRNDDLISMAMRQAGLRKYHKMMGWVMGSGFPKATRLNHGHPKTEIFEGHRYGLQALKPAIETVLIFQKPYKGKPIDNITETGAGVLNVDGGRIGMTQDDFEAYKNKRESFNGTIGKAYGGLMTSPQINQVISQGRWPANFYLDMEAARRLDEQSGNLGISKSGQLNAGAEKNKHGIYQKGMPVLSSEPVGYGDSGGASRFFFRVDEQIDDADPVRYVAKASRSERDAGLEGFELQECAAISGKDSRQGGLRSDGRKQNSDGHPMSRNPHPTIKPLALCKYLATLLLPPAEYTPRRLFIPFAGVASEVIGAMQAGWEHIEAVEITEEYIPIGQARVDYWQKQAEQMVMTL